MQEGTFVISFMMPFEWPPSQKEKIFTGKVAGNNIAVRATPNQSIKVVITDHNETLSYESCKINIQKFGYFKMAIGWDEDITIAMNGELIPNKDEGEIKVEPKSDFKLNPRNQIQFQIPQDCSHEEEVFLNAYLDLQKKVNNPSKYDLLKASGLIRQMIIDGSPVVHIVNREYRLPIKFPVVIDNQPVKVPGASHQIRNISPVFSSNEELKTLKLDDFLSTIILKDNSHNFSVKDIVKICANVKGGIHLGKPESGKEVAISDIDNQFSFDFIELSLALVNDITWSYLKGLRPLVREILKKYS